MDLKKLGLIAGAGLVLAFSWPLLIPIVVALFFLVPVVGLYLYLPVTPKENEQRSVPCGPQRENGGRPRRHIDHQDGLTYSMVDDVQNYPQVFRLSVQKYGNRPCMGVRDTLRKVKKEITIDRGGEDVKKTISIPIKTDYKYKTYKEIGDMVTAFGSGLQDAGIKEGDKLAIFIDTCPEWQVCSLACMERGIVVVTVYASLGPEALEYALSVTEVTAVFTNGKLVKKLLDAKIPSIQSVVYLGKCEEKDPADGPNLYSFEEMLEKGKVEIPPQVDLKPKDLAAIMFTSGSTGNPKGVLISHENILAGTAGIYYGTNRGIDENERYLGYLPLAHILEFCAEATVFTIGGRVGYATPHTLQGESCYNEDEKPAGDIVTLKPTCMPAVPLVLDRIRKGATKKVESRGLVTTILFKIMYVLKKRNYLRGEKAPICDKLVFNKMVEVLGGELKFLVSGGAPLSPDTQQFMNICFNAPIGQGYGATETCGNGCLTNVYDVTTGRVGPPMPSCEIRLENCQEMGYTSGDSPNPRGEICIRGPCVTAGYWQMTDEQAKSFEEDPDGKGVWFHTGDIGMWHTDGTLQIIDRKKDLVKLATGEYIALGYLEAVYKESKYVENICVYGDSFKNYPVALVIVTESAVLEFCKGAGVKGSLEEVCKRSELKQAIHNDMIDVAKKAKLKRFEQVSNIDLIADPWTPQNGYLTEAMKLKRNVINKDYKKDLVGLYK